MITKAELKTFLGITLDSYDSVIEQIIKGVESMVEGYCDNVLNEKEITEYFSSDEILDNDQEIFLGNRVNVSGLKLYYNAGSESSPTWTEESRAAYIEFLEEGRLVLNKVRSISNIGSGGREYKAVYTAGFKDADVPENLKLACLKISSAILNKRKAEGLGSESLEGQSVDFVSAMSEEVKLLLAKYKSFNV